MEPSSKVQNWIDNLINKLFLWAIPRSVTPNQVTVVRFILVPFIYGLLINNHFGWALLLFVIAASTDFIDGAMARTRDQITDVGKVIDPLADKLLILSILFYFGFKYLIIDIFIIVIIIEIFAVLLSVFFSTAKNSKTIGANAFGKIKMILQSLSIGFFILGLLTKSFMFINFSNALLVIALVFAVISAVIQVFRKYKLLKDKK